MKAPPSLTTPYHTSRWSLSTTHLEDLWICAAPPKAPAHMASMANHFRLISLLEVALTALCLFLEGRMDQQEVLQHTPRLLTVAKHNRLSTVRMDTMLALLRITRQRVPSHQLRPHITQLLKALTHPLKATTQHPRALTQPRKATTQLQKATMRRLALSLHLAP